MSSRAGSCYKFVETSENWYAARADCQIQGGDLAQITTTHKAAQMRIVRSKLGELCFINLTAELTSQFCILPHSIMLAMEVVLFL